MRIRTSSALARACLLAICAAAAVALSGCGGEEEAEPVQAVDHAQARQEAPVDVEVDGGKAGVEVTFRTITLAPGATTGEHCHYGQLVAAVAEGRLTHYAPIYPGGKHVYEAGDSIVEGPGYRHEGRNEGAEDLVLWVTYITPSGKPLAETDLANCRG